jgi:hypothetical protein
MHRCQTCGLDVPLNLRDCPSCGTHHGFPNVKMADEEHVELEARLDRARQAARVRGCEEQLARFETSCSAAHAVANVDVDFLHDLLTDDKLLYSGYGRQVAAGIRVPSAVNDDKHRTAVDGILFGSCGKDIAYAALTMNGCGLPSYGAVSLRLKDTSIANRASLLEENSYKFVVHHRIVPGDTVPRGYRASWAHRGKLAAAKMANRIQATTTPEEHAELLIAPGATRAHDEFVEVHVFGTFNVSAIQGIRVTGAVHAELDRYVLEAAERDAIAKGIAWA